MILVLPSARVVSEKACASTLCTFGSASLKPSKVAVRVASGSGSPLNNTLTGKGFADADVGGVIQRHDFEAVADRAGDDAFCGAFMADVNDIFGIHAGLFAIFGIGHVAQAHLLPTVAVFRPESRAVGAEHQIAAFAHGLAALVLVVVAAFLQQVFGAFFGDQLHGLAENMAALGGNRR